MLSSDIFIKVVTQFIGCSDSISVVSIHCCLNPVLHTLDSGPDTRGVPISRAEGAPARCPNQSPFAIFSSADKWPSTIAKAKGSAPFRVFAAGKMESCTLHPSIVSVHTVAISLAPQLSVLLSFQELLVMGWKTGWG